MTAGRQRLRSSRIDTHRRAASRRVARDEPIHGLDVACSAQYKVIRHLDRVGASAGKRVGCVSVHDHREVRRRLDWLDLIDTDAPDDPKWSCACACGCRPRPSPR